MLRDRVPLMNAGSVSPSSKNQLVVLTRYPEVGTTKTRLIPRLGAERAADLQRQMTEYVINSIRPLQQQVALSMEVHFSGGSLQQMQNWLGRELTYCPQISGDLGQRLQQIFGHGFQHGLERIVIIGADCPQITAAHLRQAFHQLHRHDAVLGPAEDGGYYLVGLSRTCAPLFHNIAWGTERVLEQTLAAAANHHVSSALLETLCDVDRPEDMRVLEHLTDFARL